MRPRIKFEMISRELRTSADSTAWAWPTLIWPRYPPAPYAMSLGLDRIKRFDYRWGFRDDAILSVLGAHVPAGSDGYPGDVREGTWIGGGCRHCRRALRAYTALSLDEPQVSAHRST